MWQIEFFTQANHYESQRSGPNCTTFDPTRLALIRCVTDLLRESTLSVCSRSVVPEHPWPRGADINFTDRKRAMSVP